MIDHENNDLLKMDPTSGSNLLCRLEINAIPRNFLRVSMRSRFDAAIFATLDTIR